MKVILLTDVPKVGRRGEIKTVPDGYGRNFLLSRGVAKIATDDVVKMVEREGAEKARKRDEENKVVDAAIVRASAKTLVLARQANGEGLLFAAVKAGDISEALAKEGIVLAPAYIDVSKPLKKKGESEVALMSPSGKKAVLKVEIQG